jgi:DNA excision repair protein ERCC-4
MVDAVTIDADVGELRSGVPTQLEARGVVVRLSQLDASDYLVGERIGVERKSVLDLHYSMMNRRLWSQLATYRAKLRRLYLLVEGPKLDDGHVSAAGIRGALLEIGDRGVSVIRSTDAADSAEWLLRLAVRAQRSGARPKPRVRRYNRTTSPVDLVSGIPGIGPRRARRLLEEFASLGGLEAAQIEELMRTEGIGPQLARAIQHALNRA